MVTLTDVRGFTKGMVPTNKPVQDRQKVFSISNFSSEIGKNGFAVPAYFMVSISLPTVLKNKFGGLDQTLPLRIESASLPDRSILTHEQRYYGPPRLVPYGFVTKGFNISVILSEDLREREAFMAWQDLMVGNSRKNPSQKTGMFDSGYYDDATKTATVEIFMFGVSPAFQGTNKVETQTLAGNIENIARDIGFDPSILKRPFGIGIGDNDRDRNKISHVYKIKLIEPYPHHVAETPLQWSNHGYSSLGVTFAYRYAEEECVYKNSTAEEDAANSPFNLRNAINMAQRFKPIVSVLKSDPLKSIATGQLGTLRNIL